MEYRVFFNNEISHSLDVKFVAHINAIQRAYVEVAGLCAIDSFDIRTIFDVVAKGWSGEMFDWMKERMMQTHQLELDKPQWIAFLGSSSIMDTIAGSIDHKYNMMRLYVQDNYPNVEIIKLDLIKKIDCLLSPINPRLEVARFTGSGIETTDYVQYMDDFVYAPIRCLKRRLQTAILSCAYLLLF